MVQTPWQHIFTGLTITPEIVWNIVQNTLNFWLEIGEVILTVDKFVPVSKKSTAD